MFTFLFAFSQAVLLNLIFPRLMIAVKSCLKHEAVVFILRTHILKLLFLLKLKESTTILAKKISKWKSCHPIIIIFLK